MKTLCLTLILCLGISVLFAQENNQDSEKQEFQFGNSALKQGKQYIIIRHDGIEYIGEIISCDNREILIATKDKGEIYIPKYEIKTITELEDNNSTVYSELKATGPFTTRYSFTTNALPIKKGENYGMLNLYGPEAHLALTDNLNAGIMTSWIASPIALAFKYSFISKEAKTNFSVGSLVGTSGYLNNFKGYGGLHWLNISLGDRRNNITFAGGYAYLQTGITQLQEGTYIGVEDFDDIEDEYSELLNTIHGPIFSIAGIFRIGPKSSFVFDSMIGYFNFESYSEESSGGYQLVETGPYVEDIYVTRDPDAYTTLLFLMPGIRFQKTDNKAFQICIAGVTMFGDMTGSFPIPMCSWFYRF